jgi:hypothetical protein
MRQIQSLLAQISPRWGDNGGGFALVRLLILHTIKILWMQLDSMRRQVRVGPERQAVPVRMML